MSLPVTKKPCIDICEFKHATCKACGRTKTEKNDWKRFSAEEKDGIWERILKTHGTGNSDNARALRNRYRKAKKKAEEKASKRAYYAFQDKITPE